MKRQILYVHANSPPLVAEGTASAIRYWLQAQGVEVIAVCDFARVNPLLTREPQVVVASTFVQQGVTILPAVQGVLKLRQQGIDTPCILLTSVIDPSFPRILELMEQKAIEGMLSDGWEIKRDLVPLLRMQFTS